MKTIIINYLGLANGRKVKLVIDENDEAVLMNTKSMQIYYCKKKYEI